MKVGLFSIFSIAVLVLSATMAPAPPSPHLKQQPVLSDNELKKELNTIIQGTQKSTADIDKNIQQIRYYHNKMTQTHD